MLFHTRILTKSFATGEIVTVCWKPGCCMHKVQLGTKEQWVSHPRQEGYRRYSHGVCRQHAQEYLEKILGPEASKNTEVTQAFWEAVSGDTAYPAKEAAA